jgi:hypothetical protein
MKKCVKCKIKKSDNLFSKFPRNTDGLYSYCRPCATKLSHRRQLAGRIKIAKLKDKPCVDCGVIFPPECMDFDHLTTKYKNVSKLCQYSTAFIKTEIAKCDLVCSNCHRIRTRKRGQNKRAYQLKGFNYGKF